MEERAAIDAELEGLEAQVGQIDATNFVRDPLYARFVEAISRVEQGSAVEPPPVALTPTQRKEKAQVAEAILRALLGKKNDATEDPSGSPMRYIAIRDLKVSPDWTKTVAVAEEAIHKAKPENRSNVRLLAFSEDGSVGAAVPKTENRDFKRAEETILRYHLQHPTLVDRRIVKLRSVRDWIYEADKNLNRYSKSKDPFALNTAESRITDIRDAVSPKAEHSAAVKHLLAGLVKSDAAKIVLDSL